MSSTFSVTLPAESRTLRPGRDGKAEVSYTVTNRTAHSARCRVVVVPLEDAPPDWFAVQGSSEHDLAADESQQFKVVVSLPIQSPAMTYMFRVDAVNVANPQEDFREGDVVALPWVPPEEPKTRLPAWLIPVLAASAIVALAIIAAIVFWPKSKPPVARSNTVSVVEDGEYTFQPGDFVQGQPRREFQIQVVRRTGGGTLTYKGNDVELGASVPSGELQQLRFRPAPDDNGDGYATVDFKLTLPDRGEVSAEELLQPPNTITINVAPAQDPPTAAIGRVATVLDGPHTFTVDDFQFSDKDGDSLAEVRITDLPGEGKLALAGQGVVKGQDIAVSAIAAGQLLYLPPTNIRESRLAIFSFKVHDGTDYSVNDYVMSVNIVVKGIQSVPAMEGVSLVVAQERLRANELKLGRTVFEFASGTSDQRVLRQSTRPGVLVAPGTEVDLVLSLPWGPIVGTWVSSARPSFAVLGKSFEVAMEYTLTISSNRTYRLSWKPQSTVMKVGLIEIKDFRAGSETGKWDMAGSSPSKLAFRLTGPVSGGPTNAEVQSGKFAATTTTRATATASVALPPSIRTQKNVDMDISAKMTFTKRRR